MKAFIKHPVVQSSLIAILSALLLTAIFFYPELEGKRIYQPDIMKFKGMSKEIADYEKKGERILWTGRMFSGMPTYQIKTIHDGNIFYYIDQLLKLGMPRSSGFLFLYFIGFFFMLRLLRFENLYALLGAIAFALSTYFIIIIQAGHTSKAHAIGYIAPLIGSIYLCYRGKYLAGGLLAALFAGLHLMANHLQITYYFLFVIAFLVIAEFINSLIQKTFPQFFKATAILIVSAILAIGPNLSNIIPTYEYTTYTMRGKTELTFDQKSTKTGLDKDYITAWSYGKDETFSLLIPNVKGGISEAIGNHQKALKNVDPQYRQHVAQMSAYFGEQPFTSGPVYVGAIIFMFFILSLFIADKNYLFWAFLAATILSLMLAWGRHFMGLTEWFIDHFPLYNKFRTVSTWLVVAEFTIPIMALMALKKLSDIPEQLSRRPVLLWTPVVATLLICFLFWTTPQSFTPLLSSEEEKQFAELASQGISVQQIEEFKDNVIQARAAIVSADALRSFIFVTLAAIAIFLWIRKIIRKEILITAILLLTALDLIMINKRYLNSSHFKNKRAIEQPYPEYPAHSFILKDRDPHFRVLNLAVNTFNDASTSYFHKSIGGYHAAKLQRYQDLITYKIHPEIVRFIEEVTKNPSDTFILNLLQNMHAINMLNTKYIITDLKSKPLFNPFHYGPAWFVDSVIFAENADEEMVLLQQTPLRSIAVVHQQFAHVFNNVNTGKDTTAVIALLSYHPHKLEYQYSAQKPQIVIFSEVYYPDGWMAYIDNQRVEMFRANYILRGIICPAGNHTITMKFEPKSYYLSKTLATTASVILILLTLGALAYTYKKEIFTVLKKQE